MLSHLTVKILRLKELPNINSFICESRDGQSQFLASIHKRSQFMQYPKHLWKIKLYRLVVRISLNVAPVVDAVPVKTLIK